VFSNTITTAMQLSPHIFNLHHYSYIKENIFWTNSKTLSFTQWDCRQSIAEQYGDDGVQKKNHDLYRRYNTSLDNPSQINYSYVHKICHKCGNLYAQANIWIVKIFLFICKVILVHNKVSNMHRVTGSSNVHIYEIWIHITFSFTHTINFSL
jgi:hypothetical protein